MGRARAAGLVAMLLVAGLVPGGCGFRTLYGSGQPGSISSNLSQIRISPIADRRGQMLRNELVERLTPKGPPRSPRWRLDVRLDESYENTGILKNESVTRVNMRLVATYALVDMKADKTVMVRSTRSLASYNVPLSEFATVVGQRDAEARAISEVADEIRTRIAIFLDQAAAGQADVGSASGSTKPRADERNLGYGDSVLDRTLDAKSAP